MTRLIFYDASKVIISIGTDCSVHTWTLVSEISTATCASMITIDREGMVMFSQASVSHSVHDLTEELTR